MTSRRRGPVPGCREAPAHCERILDWIESFDYSVNVIVTSRPAAISGYKDAFTDALDDAHWWMRQMICNHLEKKLTDNEWDFALRVVNREGIEFAKRHPITGNLKFDAKTGRRKTKLIKSRRAYIDNMRGKRVWGGEMEILVFTRILGYNGCPPHVQVRVYSYRTENSGEKKIHPIVHIYGRESAKNIINIIHTI